MAMPLQAECTQLKTLQAKRLVRVLNMLFNDLHRKIVCLNG
jgi:hypothetical protein